MATDLRELYERFDGYVVRLNADVEAAVQHLPEPLRGEFLVRRLDFDEFCVFWDRICADPATSERWKHRLRPGGYEAEHESIRRAFDRLAGAPAAADLGCERGGKAAA